jgi:uncharacterized Zn finger protein
MSKLGELRCGSCSSRGLYSRVLLRYAVGSLAPGGEIVVRCRDCRAFVKLTTENQHCDGVNTFFVSSAQTSTVAIPRTA